MHKDGFIALLFIFSTFVLVLPEHREGEILGEQKVRCEGCIIVRMISEREKKRRKKRNLYNFFYFFFLFSSLALLCAALPCAKTQTTTAVSMLVCICSLNERETHRYKRLTSLGPFSAAKNSVS